MTKPGTIEFIDQETDNIVRRSYPYVAMFNVLQKNAMLYAEMTGTDGWNISAADKINELERRGGK